MGNLTEKKDAPHGEAQAAREALASFLIALKNYGLYPQSHAICKKSVATSYTLTSPRIYRPRAYSPDHALGMMLEGSDKDFDPILLKVFINMLGVYPSGTFLYLDTGEMGLVMESPENGDKARPKIVLLKDDGQGGFKKDKAVNLAEKDPQTGLFKRKPKKSINPSVLGIQAAEFLV